MKTGHWLGRLFQTRVQPLEETIKELQDIVKEISEAEQCIWYKVIPGQTQYHCNGCKGDNKDCRGYVPLDFYKK